jgi:hypothetical protein
LLALLACLINLRSIIRYLDTLTETLCRTWSRSGRPTLDTAAGAPFIAGLLLSVKVIPALSQRPDFFTDNLDFSY